MNTATLIFAERAYIYQAINQSIHGVIRYRQEELERAEVQKCRGKETRAGNSELAM